MGTDVKKEIENLISVLKNEYKGSREVSLVITKLEEALLWFSKI